MPAMPPKRPSTLPAPKTASAHAQLSTFHCALCNKTYARHNEFAAHEASYEHNHAQRRKDLNSMNMKFAKSSSGSGGGKGDEGGIMKVKPISFGLKKKDGEGGGGFKKGGFKSAFAKVAPVEEAKAEAEEMDVVVEASERAAVVANVKGVAVKAKDEDLESESDDQGDDKYDPERPTGCDEGFCRAPR